MLYAVGTWVYVLLAFSQNNLCRLFTMYIFISENSNNLDQQFQVQLKRWCYSVSGDSFDVDSNMHKNLEVFN